jgi:hypothetical protein
MAIGLDKLDGVNRILTSRGHNRITTLETSAGPGNGAEAEYYLEQAVERYLIDEQPEEAREHLAITVAATKFAVPTTVVAIKGVGKYVNRRFSIVNAFVFDHDQGIDTWGVANEVLTVDAWFTATATKTDATYFENLAPALKERIVEHAIEWYNSNKDRDEQRQQRLSLQKAEIEAKHRRLRPELGPSVEAAPESGRRQT